MIMVGQLYGCVASYLTVYFFISPVIPFIKVLKGKMKYEDTPTAIITTNYANCFCWYLYGNLIHSKQIKLCSMIGAISNLTFIFIYLIYEIRIYTLDAILNIIIIIIGSYEAYNILTLMFDDQIGKIGICIYIIAFFSPIRLICRVVKEKNNFLIPIYTVNIFLIASLCWIIYGISLKNLYIIFPNSLGTVVSAVQIIAYFIYKNKFQNIGDNTTIDIESPVDEEGIKEDSIKIKNDEENQSIQKENKVKIVLKEEN